MKIAYFVSALTSVHTVALLVAIAGCSAGAGDLSQNPNNGGADNGGSGGAGATATTGGTGSVGTGGIPFPTGGSGGTAPTGGAGGAANTGGAGATPATGGALPYGGYDPSVQFDWPETTPSAGSCKAGSYTGTFAGTYLSPFAVLLPVPIGGNVTHRLEQAATGEFFEIKDGRVEGTADTPVGPVPFTADFVGELDCATAQLRNAYLRNGTYTVDPNNPSGTTYFFEGPVEAMYDKLANQFVNGTWAVGEPTYSQPPPLYGGSGTWTSQWTAP